MPELYEVHFYFTPTKTPWFAEVVEAGTAPVTDAVGVPLVDVSHLLSHGDAVNLAYAFNVFLNNADERQGHRA